MTQHGLPPSVSLVPAHPPAELAPRWEATGDSEDDVPVLVDPLRDLTEAGRIAQQLAVAVKREVWSRLRTEDGMSHVEIATLWGVKRANVGNTLNRGRTS